MTDVTSQIDFQLSSGDISRESSRVTPAFDASAQSHSVMNVSGASVEGSGPASSSAAANSNFYEDKESTKQTATMEELQKAAGAPGAVGSEPIPAKSLVIKTKKPRPYACPTCTRSFARLEHLKRHERSHTKEKPFQCPICERSFARRDLLLRHKQKLHASFSPTDDKGKMAESTASGVFKQSQNPQSQVYGSTPHLLGPQRTSPHNSSNGQSGQSSSSPQPILSTQLASIESQMNSQVPANATELEGLDILRPLRSSSSPQNQSQSFPQYEHQQHVGFSHQTGYAGDDSPHGSLAELAADSGNRQTQTGVNPTLLNEWKQLNPLAHELEILQHVAPPFRVLSARPSRASSFSAASATSYVRQKDIAAIAPTSAHFTQGPSEVGFATPQAYPVENNLDDFEPLDLNFVSPAQLSQPPPRKRRVSVSQNAASYEPSPLSMNNASALAINRAEARVEPTQTGPAVQALRAQVRYQRRLYQNYDSAKTDSSSSINSADFSDPSATFSSVSPPQAAFRRPSNASHFPTKALQQQQQQQYQQQQAQQLQPQQQQQFQQHQQQQYPSQALPHQQIQSQQRQISTGQPPPSHQQQQQQQQPSLPQSLPQQSPLATMFAGLDGSLGEYSAPTAMSQSYTPGFAQGFTPASVPGGLTPGMTPGMTPGFTPGMQAPMPYQTSMSPLAEESLEFKDLLAQQNDDFVNSLFDAENLSPDASGRSNSVASPSLSINNSIASGRTNRTNSMHSTHSAQRPIQQQQVNVSMNGYSVPEEGAERAANPMQRFIDAYFNGFDKHLSFVHRGAQVPCHVSGVSSVSESPAISPPSSSSSVGTGDGSGDAKFSLNQAQAAVGAQTLGERGEAQAFYWAARDHHNTGMGSLEELQADLLVTILGLFFDEPSEHAASFDRLAASVADAEMIMTPLKSPSAGSMDDTSGMIVGADFDWPANAERLWEQFVTNQSRVRTLHALHAVCCWVRRPAEQLIRSLEQCSCAPCDDDLWRAPTSDTWLRVLASKGLDARTVAETGGGSPTLFSSALSKLRAGEVPKEDISQFTLQSLLLALEAPPLYVGFSSQALRAWETLWAQSPDASLDPSPVQGPIMSDCVGVVSLVAFTPLDMSKVLRAVWQHDFQRVSLEVMHAVKSQQHGLSNIASYAVDTLVWCEGHVTSHSIFFTTLLAVTECGLVLAEALRHITSKNTPLTQSEAEIVQRSRKLVSGVLKVASPSDPVSLPNGVLRAAVCLVRLSDWPIVGVLSRTLLAHTT